MPNKKDRIRGVYSEIAKYGLALIVVLLIGAALINVQGESPAVALEALWNGIFGNTAALGNAIRWITPCIFTGAAAMVAFRSGVTNLGIEGQLYSGALAAALVGYFFKLPVGLHPLVCILIGGIVGMLIAAIPAVIKYYFNINEMITTLMLNYIVALVAEYCVVVVKGISTTNFSKAMTTPPIQETAKLNAIIPRTNANSGIFLALTVICLLFIVYKYTVAGYEMKQVGDNPRFSLVGGVKVTRMYFAIFLTSGFIAGVAGAVEAVGVYGKYMPNSSDNIGWDGIMIALVAKNSPLSVLAVAILWGTLKSGALTMELVTNTNRLTVELIQALFVLFVTVNYKKIASAVGDARKKLFGRVQKC